MMVISLRRVILEEFTYFIIYIAACVVSKGVKY